jgi:hypothetical protein
MEIRLFNSGIPKQVNSKFVLLKKTTITFKTSIHPKTIIIALVSTSETMQINSTNTKDVSIKTGKMESNNLLRQISSSIFRDLLWQRIYQIPKEYKYKTNFLI